ncbi:hypothetical protein SYYSPA8_27865 [Streptomyces yaizuensis]|uniref:Uncharacterized protein n=1 Tax=Streptomyces yaizuensis TaxID=2989713 RepID=A0ABQ5P6G5_9ACTN|nr:hypothetical protein SYYSPA8_27865 [Streptomyces sp. YSPA8]
MRETPTSLASGLDAQYRTRLKGLSQFGPKEE